MSNSIRQANVEGESTARTAAATPALLTAAAIRPGAIRPAGFQAAVARPAMTATMPSETQMRSRSDLG